MVLDRSDLIVDNQKDTQMAKGRSTVVLHNQSQNK